MALIPSVGTAYSIPGIPSHVQLFMLSFEEFRHRVNQAMRVPHDYNGWGYFDSEYVFHWVDDDESYGDMLNDAALNHFNGVGIVLMAD
ncbi:hypothetical protein A2U01_0070559, partial [Trifolium medium]|nr:hypothetical protein [Trifolium medium]